jgi:hypothetical protein
MSDKEALERLTRKCELHEMEPALGLNCIVVKADLRTLIAEREGLAADAVTALTGKVIAERRAEAAELLLRAALDALEPDTTEAFRERFRTEVRALLQPTVPVERDLGSVGSGLTSLVPSPSAANEPATPSSDDWICVGCGAEAPRKRRPCNCASGLVMTRNKDRVECAAGVFLSECSGWSRVRDALLVAYARFRDLADDIRLDPGVRNHANRAMELMDKALEG